MESDKPWTRTDLNKFIYQQTRALCEAHGFVLSPRRSKTLVRINGHIIQRICPEISRSSTEIHIYVNPTTSFCDYMFAEKTIHLRKTYEPTTELFHSYDEIGIDMSRDDIKWLYDSETMRRVWDEEVRLQIERQAISILDRFSFQEFIPSCEHRRGALNYASQTGIQDATWYMARGHNRIWQGKLSESIPLLEQALPGYETYFECCKMYEEEGDIVDASQQQAEYDATKKLLAILQAGGDDLEARVLAYMEELERTALNKTWGVSLSPEGKTVRLKKKERL